MLPPEGRDMAGHGGTGLISASLQVVVLFTIWNAPHLFENGNIHAGTLVLLGTSAAAQEAFQCAMCRAASLWSGRAICCVQ